MSKRANMDVMKLMTSDYDVVMGESGSMRVCALYCCCLVFVNRNSPSRVWLKLPSFLASTIVT